MSKKLKWFEKFTDADLELLVEAVACLKDDQPEASDKTDHCKALIAQLDKIRQSMKGVK